jgi:hypothetical protein
VTTTPHAETNLRTFCLPAISDAHALAAATDGAAPVMVTAIAIDKFA